MKMKETIHLKVSKEDKQFIQKLAKSRRLTMCGYIRNEILNKKVNELIK
tara:strand:+ start:87 stop:233 length:147 start_codon:yes stop_codon:yes gene_type:complete